MSTDWTVVERLQLDTLVSCLPARLADEIEFGVSDSGDPWCAVLNEDGEVVLHVARIAGRFYVHSTIEPFVAESRDLPTAVAPFIGDSFLQQRHVATITPMYGLVLPLHAYAMPSEMPVEPRAEMLDDAPAAPLEVDASTPELPQAPEPWSAPVFTLGAADQPLEPQPQVAEQVLFPIQESDWGSPMSGQLLDFSAPQRIESIASLEFGDVTFEPFVLTEAAPAIVTVEAPAVIDDGAETVSTGDPAQGGPAGGNVISIDFGQSSTGAGFTPPHNGLTFGALDGLERAASGAELVISDVDPGVVVAWTDTPATLMGVVPAAEAF